MIRYKQIRFCTFAVGAEEHKAPSWRFPLPVPATIAVPWVCENVYGFGILWWKWVIFAQVNVPKKGPDGIRYPFFGHNPGKF